MRESIEEIDDLTRLALFCLKEEIPIQQKTLLT
jgi:hypothetical protein